MFPVVHSRRHLRYNRSRKSSSATGYFYKPDGSFVYSPRPPLYNCGIRRRRMQFRTHRHLSTHPRRTDLMYCLYTFYHHPDSLYIFPLYNSRHSFGLRSQSTYTRIHSSPVANCHPHSASTQFRCIWSHLLYKYIRPCGIRIRRVPPLFPMRHPHS